MPSFSLITFVLILVQFLMDVNSTTHWQDVEILKQLKNSVDPNSVTQGSCIDSWDFTLDPCDNLFKEKFTCGFRCDVVVEGFSRVTELALDSAYYSGSLSNVTWNLPYLQNFDVSNNYFNGSVPGSFSQLTRLQRLGLSRNLLSGSVPESLGSLSNLEEMYLDNNKLEGTIPSSFNGLKNLKRLELQGNRLSGEFPQLTQLSNLNYLDSSDNAISGNLPANFPEALIEISMRNNQIEGNIPSNVISCAYLQVMDLSHNRLSGSVPPSLFTHPSLQQLTLSYNQYDSVPVPGNSGLTSELISVDLSNNNIHGFLPGFMGLMPKLSALSLENNKFSGMIPAQYALKVLAGSGTELAQFARLLLGGNYLLGPIPGLLLELHPGSVTIRLGNNCFFRCPVRWFFCEGGAQKSLKECRAFGPIIP